MKKHLDTLKIPVTTLWLLGNCMEARGKQDLWLQTKPELLDVLRELAIIQSAESSNRIEGVTVEKERLLPLLQKKVKPRDRSEEEVFGYRKALDWIHKSYSSIVIQPDSIRHLHLLAQSGFSGDAGEYKKRNNEIIEIQPNGLRQVRFVPVDPKHTPKAVEQLCLSYKHVQQQSLLPDLLAIAAFILDFLCIHPFRDGNGRVSRLLSLLLVYQSGYKVGKYISFERIIEGSKDDYYEVLKQSSQEWHEGRHDLLPFVNYFLGHIKTAYGQLSERVALQSEYGGGKSDLIRKAILARRDDFTLGELTQAFQSSSQQLIKKILSQLKNEKKISLAGRGRSAKWKVLRHRVK